jgi:nucleoid DNA-binding protein
MNKADIVRVTAERIDLNQKDTKAVVEAILREITNGLSRGERLEIRGFGAFVVKHRAKRVGRNISTGETVSVPERKVPVFIPGKVLKRLVDK